MADIGVVKIPVEFVPAESVLRDYFAAAVMQGIIISGDRSRVGADLCADVYEIADLMLAARAKTCP